MESYKKGIIDNSKKPDNSDAKQVNMKLIDIRCYSMYYKSFHAGDL